MLRFDLKAALDAYEARTGLRLTYEELSRLTGISDNTLKSISSRKQYNTTLKNIDLIAVSLNFSPIDFMIWEKNEN